MPAPPELKATLNLPQTDFPMKANLPQSEPKRLAAWEQEGLYEQIRAVRQDAPSYVLHDGPPYANGPLHLGHALNKCLKDFVVKSKTMAGFNAPYVPGLGLPRPADRDQSRRKTGPQEAGDAGHRGAPRLPRVCPEIPRPAAVAVPAPGRFWAVGPALLHHDAGV